MTILNMNTTIIIHSNNDIKLLTQLKNLQKIDKINKYDISIQSNGSTPWNNDEIVNLVKKYRTYSVFPTNKTNIESVVEMVLKCKTDNVLILTDDFNTPRITSWDDNNDTYLLSGKKDIIRLNLDTKYSNISSFLIDLKSQFTGKKYETLEGVDLDRYNLKFTNQLFNERIIYVDGGLGDHIMSLPLLNKLSKEVYVCCKYPFVFEHLPVKGFVNWNDDLFGGYKRFVYEYGSANNSKTIIDAFFQMYGIERSTDDILKYTRDSKIVEEYNNDNKLILICTSAAKINDKDSNKDWNDIRWFKLVNELKSRGYYVVQVGTIKDNQIPNVNAKFLDKSLQELKYLIEKSTFWISVDTFFHHFASSVKPDVGICLTPYYNDHAKHPGVKYIEKDCGKNFSDRKWWLDLQQPERKECMDLIMVDDVLKYIKAGKLKIGIYSRDINDNCSNWRCFQQYLGFEDAQMNFKRGFGSNLADDITDDIIVVCRPIYNCVNTVKLLKSKGVKIIVDYDDAFPLLQMDDPNYKASFMEVMEIMDTADLIITSTERLKYYFSLFTKTRCEVIPNIINPKLISQNKRNNDDKIILGWYGSAGHIMSIEPIKDVLLRVLNEHDNVYLNIYSNNPQIYELLKHERSTFIPYDYDFLRFQETVGDIDINVAPISETYINLHKSNIRILLPGYKGIPSVASKFAEYKDLGGENVVLCETLDDWYNGLKLLITDEVSRNRYGQNIKNKIENELVYDKWTNFKMKLFKEIL